MPFTQYITTVDGAHSGSTRFHVSTASLDRVWAAFRADAPGTQGAPIRVQGHKAKGLTAATSVGTAAEIEIGRSSYDSGGVLGADSEKYIGKAHNFKVTGPTVTAQFNVNGSLIPGFPANFSEWYNISKNAVGASCGAEPTIKTFDQYLNNYAVICQRFCLPESGPRTISGLDSRATSMQGSLVTNETGNPNVLIWCECHSVLQIGAQKQFAIVV